MACDVQTNKERQEDELQVLEAVFMGDVKDLRKTDVWKTDRPLDLKITVKPQQSMGGDGNAYVQVDMTVTCSSFYPDEPPDIKLSNPKGLSDSQLFVLKTELGKQAKKCIGEVMILELANYVQMYLHSHNKPPSKSFYEEMMSNKRKQKEQLEKEQQKKIELLRRKEEKEIQLIEDEIQRRQAALKEEIKRKKETQFSYQVQNMTYNTDSPILSSVSSDCPLISPITPATPSQERIMESPVKSEKENGEMSNPKSRRRRSSTPKRQQDSEENNKNKTAGIVVIAFNMNGERIIHRGKCLGQSQSGSTVYAGIDTSTGDIVAITEWTLKWKHSPRRKILNKNEEEEEGAKYMKQITSIEQEMMSLVRLKHKNLINYLAMKYLHDNGTINVYILMEYVGGSNLEIHIKRKIPVPVSTIRVYTEDLLMALDYLHRKAVVHKNIRASSVFIDNVGRLRLADFSIDKRLYDLYDQTEQNRPGVHFTEPKPSVLSKAGKKGDIYQLGILLLSLARGINITNPQQELPGLSDYFPVEFCDFLNKCLMSDETHRWSVYQLLEHTFIKEPFTCLIENPKRSVCEEKPEDIDELDDEKDLQGLPFITALEASGFSRLTTEFEILKSLGKGGFGDVIKVRNRLDQRLYAIKRIPLNPKSRQFNKKITREVKLLSRLNHENVVRYYNSWIETSDSVPSDESSLYTSESDKKSSDSKVLPVTNFLPKNSLNITDDIEKFAPKPVEESIEWSVSYDVSKVEGHVIESSSDDDDEDEDNVDVFGSSFLPHIVNTLDDSILFDHEESSSGSVVFESDSKLSTSNQETGQISTEQEKKQDESRIDFFNKMQYLYIQMEYCERSTLRNCIDAGLWEDTNRVWRLFREIIEGLVHIHEQGMIHRDLKPVNIFLDSNDHVKIGDFGLATTDVIHKQSGLPENTVLSPSAFDVQLSSSSATSQDDGNLTGKVGTALYVSPEMASKNTKAVYSQKVDIYSLGIIFFEMCYRSLSTGMERITVLTNIRQSTIQLPEDFDELEYANQAHIVRLLLNHDPCKRPTSKELLQSEYLPPPQMEETQVNDIIRSTVSNPQSKAYRHMIDAMFSQSVNPVSEVTYDMEVYKGQFSVKLSLTQSFVQEKIEKIFQRHGAVKVNTPLLIPKSDLLELNEQNVALIDRNGGLTGLPYDLRAPFARHVARRNIQYLKRYCIDRVYRERKPLGTHPRELIECAFDIITTSEGSLIQDGEVLVIVQEIINEFQPLQGKNYYVQINHACLLRSILLHCGVPSEEHDVVLQKLLELQSESQKKYETLKACCKTPLTDQNLANLKNLLDTQGPHNKVASMLKCITKTKGMAGSLAKQGLHEVEAVLNNAENLGLKLQTVITLGLVYNIQQYSGVIFQIMCNVKKKNRIGFEVLAAGGRYDKLLEKFHTPWINKSMGPSHSGVGVSLNFERIVSSLIEYDEFIPSGPYDILVCTIGHKPMMKERMSIVKDLWAAGLKTQIMYDTLQDLEEIQDYCRKARLGHIVILKDTESMSVKVRTLEKDKITEKKLMVSEIVEYLQQRLQITRQDSCEVSVSGATKQSGGPSQSHTESTCSSTSGWSSVISVSFNFFIQDKNKLPPSTRRKIEMQIYGKVSSLFSWLTAKLVEIVVFECNVQLVKYLAAYLELDGEEKEYNDSIKMIMENLPAKQRKYMSKIFDCIYEIRFTKKSAEFIILYELNDDVAKLLSCQCYRKDKRT